MREYLGSVVYLWSGIISAWKRKGWGQGDKIGQIFAVSAIYTLERAHIGNFWAFTFLLNLTKYVLGYSLGYF
jgi:hypothetical protein